MKAGRLLSLGFACVLLATVSVAAGATPLAGPCAPGMVYDPACDVDHNGTVNINDIQLTAGHWNQTGTWVSDNQHNHLAQEWTATGTNNTLRLTGSYGAPDYAPLVLSNSAGIGLVVGSAGGSGVAVLSAGVEGVFVGSADLDGVHVESAGDDGLFVAKTGSAAAYAGSTFSNGVEIGNAEDYGVRVNSAGNDGVYVDSADSAGVAVGTASVGVYVYSTGGSGVVVNDAGANGVQVDFADDDGFRVEHAGNDGLFVCRTGSATDCDNNALNNGVEIGNAEGDGVLVLAAGYNGVWAHTTRPGHDYGFYTPDRIYAGTTLLQSLLLVALVDGPDVLTPGDVVAAVGVTDPLPGSPVHVPLVRLADGKSGGVVGVVERRLALVQAGELLPADDGGAPIEPLPPELHSADGPAQAGDYVAITVLGAAQVKVDSATPIEAGQRLTIAANGRARPLGTIKVQLAGGEGTADVAESAPVLGVALEAATRSRSEAERKDGLVWVLVNPQ